MESSKRAERPTTARRIGLVMLVCLGGCAVASPPIKDMPQVVATPQNGQLSTSMQAGKAIGDVQPVYVSVANGTDEPRAIVPSQIFAINDVGERVAPLSPGEAARQAGGAGGLKAALSSAAVSGASGVATGAVGAGLGAIASAGLGGGWGTGALVGAAVGAGSGMLYGATQGQNKADEQATTQLQGVALQEGDVRRNFTVSGYVFFPKGTYRELEMVLVNHETGDTESIHEPWH